MHCWGHEHDAAPNGLLPRRWRSGWRRRRQSKAVDVRLVKYVRVSPIWQGTRLLAVGVAFFLLAPGSAEATNSTMRSAALKSHDLPGFLSDLEQPARESIIENPHPFLTEVREQTVVDSWQRLLIRPDYLRTVTVELIQFRNRETAEALTAPKGSRDSTPPPLPTSATATVGEDHRKYAERAAVFYVGPVFVRIETIAYGRDAGRFAEGLLSRAAAIQADRIGRRPQIAETTIKVDSLKRRMDVAMFSSLLIVIALVTLVTWARDPSARRRLRLRWSDRPRQPEHALDVDAEARRLIRRHAIEASVRIGFAFSLAAIALFLPIGALETALLFTAGLALWGWLENHDWMPGHGAAKRNPRLFRGWALLGGVLGTLASLALAGAGLFLVWLGVLSELFGVPELEPRDIDKVKALHLILGVALIVASAIPLRLARRLSMRQAHRRLTHDKRDPVLLLRAFSDDGIKLRARRTRRHSMFDRIALRRWDRLEEILAAQLDGIGPVEAIGEPGSRLPPLGAVRRSYQGEAWRTGVQELISEAALIVVDLGRTRSLAWEVAQIRDRDALKRTLFVLPPVPAGERRARLHALAEVLDMPAEYLDHELPGLEILAIVVPNRMRPLLLTSGARDDVSYELAVEAGVGALRGFAAERKWPAPTAGATRPVPFHGAFWFEPGQAPWPKRWYRRYWVWVGLLAIGLPAVTTLVSTDAPDLTGFEKSMPLAGDPRILLAVPGAERVIAVENRNGPGAMVEEVDLVSQDRRSLGSSSALLSDGTLGEGWVVLSSARDDVVTGIELHGDGRWEMDLKGNPRGIAIDGGAAFVALTEKNEVVELSLTSGAERDRTEVGSAPWGVAKRHGIVLVTLAGSSEIAAVDPNGLELKGRRRGVPAPREIDTGGPRTWVLSASRGAFTRLAGGGAASAKGRETPLAVVGTNSRYAATTTGDGSDLALFDRKSGATVREMNFDYPLRTVAITDSNEVVIGFVDVAGLGLVK